MAVSASNLGQDKSWDQILSARWMIMFPLCSPLSLRVNHGMWVALESDPGIGAYFALRIGQRSGQWP